MASLEDLTTLREYVNEPDDTNGWTDDRLSGILDAGLTPYSAAGRVWALKAGQYSTLVDVSESGSTRKLSDLRKNAMEMAKHYNGLEVESVEVISDRPVVQRIRRGFV